MEQIVAFPVNPHKFHWCSHEEQITTAVKYGLVKDCLLFKARCKYDAIHIAPGDSSGASRAPELLTKLVWTLRPNLTFSAPGDVR